jgi:hypothetical protein
MAITTLSRQDFARLVQDRLIGAGEDRPLEYDAAGFTLLPRGTLGRGQAVPLAPFHQMYLANPKDLDFVVKQFVEFWKGSQKPVVATAVPTFVAPAPAAKFTPPPEGGAYPAYPPRPRSGGIGTVVLVLVGSFLLFVFLVFAAPLILVLVLLNQNPPGPPPGAFGPAPGNLPAGASVTEVVGGQGGSERLNFDSQARPLVGVAYAIDENWDSGGSVLGTLWPIYDHGVAPEEPGRPTIVEQAKDGYVVAGLVVDTSRYVNAVKVIYVRQQVDAFDPSDTYESAWLGKPRGERETRLGGDGQIACGLHCKQGLVLDAVGLIVRPAPVAAPPDAEDAVGQPVNPFEQAAEVTPP